MSLTRYATVALVCFFFAAPGKATSFDCSRAASRVEKLICGNEQLSKLDDDLTNAYADAAQRTGEAASLRKQQREWLGNVRNRCSAADCLKSAYTARNVLLARLKKQDLQATGIANQEDRAACGLVADFANRGELRRLNVQYLATQPEEKELKRIFGDDPFYMGYEYWVADLNNDGVQDHLLITVDGTMRVGNGYGLSGKKGSTVAQLNDFEAGNIDLTVLIIGGRYYVLSGYGMGLSKLWRMNQDGEFETVCGFSARKEPLVQLTAGDGNPVCTLLGRNQVRHVEYKLTHALGNLPGEDRFWSKHPLDGMAKADIDNDGKPDNIVRIDFTHGGGRGCGATYIAVANASRTALPDIPLNRLLLEELGGVHCGPDLDVLVHNGTTYVEASEGAGTRTLYRINDNKAETVCEFRGRTLYNVNLEPLK